MSETKGRFGRTTRVAGAVALFVLIPVTTAGAATVRVEEVNATYFGAGESSTLIFEAAPGEQNDVNLRIAAKTPTEVTYGVTDASAAATPGAGCSGGGAPGIEVLCQMKTSRPMNCVRTLCADLGRAVLLQLGLGDGTDSLAAGTLTGDGGGGLFRTDIDAGDGDDGVISGAVTDTIDPGPGADSVESGAGGDRVVAATAGDGADRVDLGEGTDTIDYSTVTAPVSISLDGVANDGTIGEGDNVLSAESLIGGPGRDALFGAAGGPTGPGPAETFAGGAGKDLIMGNGGDDSIRGGEDNDRIFGGEGDDFIDEFGQGPNRIDGGPGSDDVIGGSGTDRISGGPGDDQISGYRGGDFLDGGRGDDVINSGSRDHARDRIDCGGATDLARVGPEDVAQRCEHLR